MLFPLFLILALVCVPMYYFFFKREDKKTKKLISESEKSTITWDDNLVHTDSEI